MKRIIVTVLGVALVLTATTGVFAQTALTGFTGKGFKVGLNLANITGGDAPDETSMRMGFAGGGWITYAFSDLFAVQPELFYTMKGYKYDYTDPITLQTETYTFKADYIEIPVLAKISLSGASNFKPNFYAGPSFAFLLSAKNGDTDVKDNMKSTDFGLIGGVGADYLLGTGKITFDVRYNVGLTSTDDSGNDFDVKNSAITFLVGYGF